MSTPEFGRLVDVEASLQRHGPFILSQFFAESRKRFNWQRGEIFCLDPNHPSYVVEEFDNLYDFVQDHWDCEAPEEIYVETDEEFERAHEAAAMREGAALDAARAAAEGKR